MSDYRDIDPGIYENDSGARALVDQQRAGALEGLRATRAVSVTWLDDDGDATHWAFYSHDDDAFAFLVYALCRAWRDAKAAMDGISDDRLTELVRLALDEGVGT